MFLQNISLLSFLLIFSISLLFLLHHLLDKKRISIYILARSLFFEGTRFTYQRKLLGQYFQSSLYCDFVVRLFLKRNQG